MTTTRTLFEKIWREHLVAPETEDTPAVLYVDLHLIHEVTSPQAFGVLRERGLPVRQPGRTLATMDHAAPTQRVPTLRGVPVSGGAAAEQMRALAENCEAFGIELHALGDEGRGIVHVIGPELGVTLPGMTIVCGDSHTSTHGAFGALAFGIGTTEVAHVLATQCLLQRKPRSMAITLDGQMQLGVTAKDLILATIGQIGVSGGTGHVIEYRGSTIEALSMEERMTVCNMSIEAGARAGLIAPDATTFEYLASRPRAPREEARQQALERWRRLPTDAGAGFDREARIDASSVEPMITWGTNPGMVIPIHGRVPDEPDDPEIGRALDYMNLSPGQPLLGHRLDVVFIGSCTNSRLGDLREAARILRGRRVAKHLQVLVVPGSQAVKREAEVEGLAQVFVDAGAEWRESGCSMCIAMNGDAVGRGQYAVSTSNRNFEGRQGAGARSFLASPTTAAACAVRGEITDPRDFL